MDTVSGNNGNDTLYGGSENDTLSGGDDNDSIFGEAGTDSIDGGAGDDLIYFDELDAIDGGDGWDVAIYSSNLNTSSVNLDATQHHLEVVVAGLGADTLAADGSTEAHLAGLDGDDTFNVAGDGGAPTIVWGGTGADTISIAATDPSNPSAHGQIGIMVVNVTNLNEGNFQDFDLSMVSVGVGFDWSQIDVVVLNPESTD